jgi:hypothetical protein
LIRTEKEISPAAMKLPREVRARLAQILLDSLINDDQREIDPKGEKELRRSRKIRAD